MAVNEAKLKALLTFLVSKVPTKNHEEYDSLVKVLSEVFEEESHETK